MLLKDGRSNSISDKRFDVVAEAMTRRHAREFETVHNGSGRSEEMPSDLDLRHRLEWDALEQERRTLSVMQWLKQYPYSRVETGPA
jgi:hypothetical protein